MKNKVKNEQVFLRFIAFISQYKKQILLLSCLQFLASAFLLATPYLSNLFIDKAFLKKDVFVFYTLSLWSILVFAASSLAKLIKDIAQNKISLKLKLTLSKRLIRKLFSLDLEYFKQNSVGENTYRLFDVETVNKFITDNIPNLISDLLKLFSILGISFFLSARLTLLLVAFSPLFALRSLYIRRRLRLIYDEMWEYNVKLSKVIYESFSGILIIKALRLELEQIHKYLKYLIAHSRWQIKGFKLSLLSSVTSFFLSKAVYGAIALYGGWLIIKGGISLGRYTGVMVYITQLAVLLDALSLRFEYIVQEMVSAEKFFEVMERSAGIKDLPGSVSLKTIKGEIVFNNISFGYLPGRPLFRDLQVSMPTNAWVALIGPSGCGKTTLMNLLLRFYEPWKGAILVDQKDVKNIKLESLRETIVLATQQPFLFNISVAQNICYGVEEISRDAIIEAAYIAGIAEFIEQLPEQYDTVIGEDGSLLSQGLKQRLALARSIIRKPRILVLDEALSSVDLETEKRILVALRKKRIGLGTIIISHRVHSISDADRIYFLQKDGTMQEGGHALPLKDKLSYE